MIQFGTNPIAWANDDDQTIGADIPTERILREAGEEIGFDGIENGHRWPEDPEKLRALLAAHGLKFISGWYSTHLLTRSVEDEINAARRHIAKLKHNGCKVMIVCETSNAIHGDATCPVNDRPRLTPDEMKAFGKRLETFATYLAGEGLTLVYHHHMGTIVESPGEIDALMAATGPKVHLLFDAGHCYFGGGDPEAVLKRHVGRVRHFHAKNVRPDVMARVRNEVGEAVADYESIDAQSESDNGSATFVGIVEWDAVTLEDSVGAGAVSFVGYLMTNNCFIVSYTV